MRATLAPAFLMFLAACGGGGTQPSPPPPPSQPGPPASVTVQAGDGQQGEPGATLAAKPAVLVKDAAGRSVPNVSVTFSVDSGGGTIAGSQAITGTDGVATAGDWKLGAVQGSNVLLVTVPGLSPAKIRATAKFTVLTLLDSVPVAPSGGTVTFTKTGDALSGVAITVPDGAFPTAVRFSILADPGIQAPLPDGVTQIGPAFIVGNGQGYAELPMALKLPIHAGGDTVLAAFYYEPESGTLENVPLVARDDQSITMATRHFSADKLLLKGDGGASLRASLGLGTASPIPPPFGRVIILVVATTPAILDQPLTTGFTPGLDDWEFINRGTWLVDKGICGGMSITAMYYYYRFRPGGRPLNHQFDTFRALEWDNPQGERFASEVQRAVVSINLDKWAATIDSYALGSVITADQLYYQSLALSIMVTRQPQLLAIFATGQDVGGHAIVAFAVNHGVIFFADPNFPGLTRTTTYANGAFASIAMQVVVTQSTVLMDEINFVGATTLVDMKRIDAEWSDFQRGAAGRTFPKIGRDYFDQIAREWVPISSDDIINTTAATLALRSSCAECGPPAPHDPEYPPTYVRDTLNNVIGSKPFTADTAALISTRGAPSSFRVSIETFLGNLKNFTDQHFVKIVARPFAIDPVGPTGNPNTDLHFTATNSGLATSAWGFTWDFDDGTAPVTRTGDSTVVHQWRATGTYTLKAEMRDPTGKLIGIDRTTVTIRPTLLVWQIDAVTLISKGGTPPPDATAALGLQNIQGWVDILTSTPNLGSLFFFPQAIPTGQQGLWLEVSPNSNPVTVFDPMLGMQFAKLASNEAGGITGFLNGYTLTGTTSQGTIIGQGPIFRPTGALGGHVNGVFSGNKLSGTMDLILLWFGGTRYTFSLQFSATQH